MEKTAAPKSETIACIGWGSLIWDTSRPFSVKGSWRDDGPSLPLEFARQSADNRMTLVLVDMDHHTPTLWVELDATSLDQAVSALAEREGVPNKRVIGRWPNDGEEQYLHQSAIAEWAIGKGLTGVVWTALPPGMKGCRGTVPTLAEMKTYLVALSGLERSGAIEYIHRAPRQIATPYRSELEISFPVQHHKVSDHD
ncbi:hypothetical protein J2Y55_002134 [Bosea sp. BE125]|uniref:hypothetical protein n=1 Tax=Bosea sp. BE125 TaxID=2817909 RepID=UPI00285B304A|nr:hypothetical protein [Bosea sp. BE125]MDR6871126.1 hypothetical protein [Bosea sp. BE125]